MWLVLLGDPSRRPRTICEISPTAMPAGDALPRGTQRFFVSSRKLDGAALMCPRAVEGRRMEHRYGQRHPADVHVYIRGGSGKLFSAGILSDLSISGGFIRTSLMAEPLSTVVIQFTGPDQGVRAMTARVIRRTPQGLGVEWAEFATELVQILTRPATEATPVAKAG